jgi:pimeloyl-ACP methyl ester carboxylesterase
MTENSRLLHVNDVELAVQTFGDDTDPAVLLIMGAAASMDWWPEEFCVRLAARSRYVIRYDLRDTGQSTSYEPGSPPYSSADLLGDAVGILDVLGVKHAHIVGMSMGGGLTQHLATDHADRVRSVTLISTTFAGSAPEGLPSMSDDLEGLFAEAPDEPDWSDRGAVVEFMVSGMLAFQGSVRTGEAELRELVGYQFDRSRDMAATNSNHWILDGGGLPEANPATIRVPALVIHGTEDPLFPYAHAEALAAAIPGAQLVALEGVGHGELPPPTWDVAVDAISEVTSRSAA